MSPPVFGEMAQVRFVVITPDAPDAQPEAIYCSLSLDGWPSKGRPLQRVAPNVYTGEWVLRAGAWIEYKFLREEDWNTVEKGLNQEEMPNRRLLVQANVGEHVVSHCIPRWNDRQRLNNTAVEFNSPGEGTPLARVSTLTGDIRQHHLVHSPELSNARTIMVYLPPGYDDALDDRYPVLYMHDGNNLFDAKTSAAGVEWGVDETAERLIHQDRIRPVIIVGIYNTPQRTKEYTPFKDVELGGGMADAYVQFIVNTLKPFIDKTYRTLPGRKSTTIAGSSLGGLVSLYALFKEPEVFGAAGVISPALWWAKRRIFNYIKRAGSPMPMRLWLDMGTEEGESAGPLAEFNRGTTDCARLVRLLEEKGYVGERDFKYDIIEGGRHHEFDWAMRVDRVLTYLYGRELFSKPVARKREEAVSAGT